VSASRQLARRGDLIIITLADSTLFEVEEMRKRWIYERPHYRDNVLFVGGGARAQVVRRPRRGSPTRRAVPRWVRFGPRWGGV
jgi:hypothetical protein